MTSTKSRGVMGVFSLVTASMLIFGLASCNIVGPAAVILQGPPTIDAQFELPKERPTLIFIDDRATRLGRKALRNIIAESAQNLLLKEKVLVNVIDSRAGFVLSDRETAEMPMDIVTIGKTVEAEIVIFATVDSFGLSPDGQTFLPAAELRVKVLDITKDSPRIWPLEEAGGFPLRVQPMQRTTSPQTPGEVRLAQDAFAKMVGEGIAKLFFEHEARESLSGPR